MCGIDLYIFAPAPQDLHRVSSNEVNPAALYTKFRWYKNFEASFWFNNIFVIQRRIANPSKLVRHCLRRYFCQKKCIENTC
jgi:hypothetical protein